MLNQHPKVFVVIPVHNRLEYTKKCLVSLSKQSYSNYQVIVVDDGSTDGTYSYIHKKYPKWKIIKGDGSWWWTKSIFMGVKSALKEGSNSDFVLTMNNDCFFKSNYISNLVKSSVENNRAITGSLILYANRPNEVMDAGVKIDWNSGHIYAISDSVSNELSFYNNREIVSEVDTLPGKGTLIPFEVFEKIGNFNYHRLPHYIGDYEFFCRAKSRGENIIVSCNSKLYNFEKATGTSHSSSEKMSYMEIFNLLFARKSKLNIIDQINFTLLCCPKKHLFKNLVRIVQKITAYLFLLAPFSYIVPVKYYIKLFIHNTIIVVKQSFSRLTNKNLLWLPKIKNETKHSNSEPYSVSYGYEKISLKEANKYKNVWKDAQLPKKQWEVVETQISQKDPPEVAQPAINIVKNLDLKKPSLLDVGCSSGYYSDFFKNSGVEVKYEGTDFSREFIKLARKIYPKLKFVVASMTSLPYPDNSFQIVLVSGSLHCVRDYQKALKECTRVSSKYVLLHRLPVFVKSSRSETFTKVGYGVKMMEIIFSNEVLEKLYKKNNLKVIKRQSFGRLDIPKAASWDTVLLKKKDTI